MKPALFCRNQRRLRTGRWVRVPQALRAALTLPAAALLLYSCDPPASPSSVVPEVTRISGPPNMAQIERRLNAQYAETAQSIDGVSFALDKPEISPDGKTVVRAKITYAPGKLLSLKVGGKDHQIQTVEIQTTVDQKANPTTFAYKDTSNETQKKIFLRYVKQGQAFALEGREEDRSGKTLCTFTGSENGARQTLNYSYPDKKDYTETVIKEDGILISKVITHPDKRIEELTYAKAQKALYYPPKPVRTVKKDKDGKLTNSVETKADGSKITTTPRADGGTFAERRDAGGNVIERVTTTPKTDGGTLAVHKNKRGGTTKKVETQKNGESIETSWPGFSGNPLIVHRDAKGRETKRINTDKSTIETSYPAGGGTLVVHKNAGGTETSRVKTIPTKGGGKLVENLDRNGKLKNSVETKADKSTITTTPKSGGTLAVYRNAGGTETKRIETKADKSSIMTSYPAGGKLIVYRDKGGKLTNSLETKADGSTITTTATKDGGTLAVHKHDDGTVFKRVETKKDKSSVTTKFLVNNPTREVSGTTIVYRDAGGKLTKSIETREDKSTITTTRTADGGTLVVRKDKDGKEKNRFKTTRTSDGGTLVVSLEKPPGNRVFYSLETRKDKSTIQTDYRPDSTDVVYKDARGKKTREVRISKDKSRKETTYRADGGKLVVDKDASGKKTMEVETNKDGSTKATVYRADGSTLTVETDKGGKITKQKETVAPECASTDGDVEVLSFGNGSITTKGDKKHLCLMNSHDNNNNMITGYENKDLTSIKLNSKAPGIRFGAFRGNKLTKLSIPPSVKKIEDIAFADNQLKEVILPKELYDKRGRVFLNNPAGIKFYEYDASKPGNKGRLLGTH